MAIIVQNNVYEILGHVTIWICYNGLSTVYMVNVWQAVLLFIKQIRYLIYYIRYLIYVISNIGYQISDILIHILY